MTTLGLMLITLSWAYELYQVTKGNKTVPKAFVALYSLGVLFLIIGGPGTIIANVTSLDGLSFILSVMVLLLLFK